MKYQTLLRLLLSIFCLFTLINIVTSSNVKKSVNDEMSEDNDLDDEDESFSIPMENEINNLTCTRRQNSLMHEIRTAQVMQFPFVGAIMSHQNEYLCAGSVVSNGLILTSAVCTQQDIGYVLLNTTRNKKGPHTTALHIIKTEKFPTFTGSDSLKDVGLIYAEKHNGSVASKIRLSSYTNARNLIDIEAIGFGLNADVGQPKELQYVGMELRSPLENADILKAYFDCVNTIVPTCFRDFGGPAIHDNQLIGIVIHGQGECTKEMSATYAINKKMADILPTFTFKAWLDERINKNEKVEPILTVFPNQPKTRRMGTSIKIKNEPKRVKMQQTDKSSPVITSAPAARPAIWHPPPKPKPRAMFTSGGGRTSDSGNVLKSSHKMLLLVFYPILSIY